MCSLQFCLAFIIQFLQFILKSVLLYVFHTSLKNSGSNERPKQFVIDFNEAGFQEVPFCTLHGGSPREELLEQETAPLEQRWQNVVLYVASCSGAIKTELLLRQIQHCFLQFVTCFYPKPTCLDLKSLLCWYCFYF